MVQKYWVIRHKDGTYYRAQEAFESVRYNFVVEPREATRYSDSTSAMREVDKRMLREVYLTTVEIAR